MPGRAVRHALVRGGPPVSRRLFAVAAVSFLIAAAGLAVLAGVVSLPDAAAGPGTPTAADSGTPTAAPGGAGDSSTPNEELTDTSGDPFSFAVEQVEQCGRTCRDVTTSLVNRQSSEASNVTVRTRIYAGNGTSGDPVWTGEERVGTLAAGASETTTKRVSLSLSDALEIERNGGWITVETTVRSDGETMTVVEHRDVN
jgi:hypothetical protein